MISREEVAKKIRKIYEYDCYEMAIYEIDTIIGTEKSPLFQDFLNRLADLIDPTCRIYYTDTSTSTPDTGYESDGYYSCSCCGELDDCFQEMWDDYQAKGYDGEPPFRYCPNCGARVVRDE